MKSWFSPATAFCYISLRVFLISLSFLDWQVKGVSPPWNTAGRSSSCGKDRQTSARLTCQKVKLGIKFILLPEVNKVSSRLLQLLGLFPVLHLCVSSTLAVFLAQGCLVLFFLVQVLHQGCFFFYFDVCFQSDILVAIFLWFVWKCFFACPDFCLRSSVQVKAYSH